MGSEMCIRDRCSCYPWPVLGLPPVWYKSPPYRSRAVKDPRGVLSEFGLDLSEEMEVRVWDSTAEVRYMVLPERPEGTDALSEAELAELITRDSMIGVERVEVFRRHRAPVVPILRCALRQTPGLPFRPDGIRAAGGPPARPGPPRSPRGGRAASSCSTLCAARRVARPHLQSGTAG